MAGMHCTGMQTSHSSEAALSSLQLESRDVGLCRHASPIATLSSASSSERVEAVHGVFLERVRMRRSVAAYQVLANLKAPPLRSSVDPLLVTLRV